MVPILIPVTPPAEKRRLFESKLIFLCVRTDTSVFLGYPIVYFSNVTGNVTGTEWYWVKSHVHTEGIPSRDYGVMIASRMLENRNK